MAGRFAMNHYSCSDFFLLLSVPAPRCQCTRCATFHLTTSASPRHDGKNFASRLSQFLAHIKSNLSSLQPIPPLQSLYILSSDDNRLLQLLWSPSVIILIHFGSSPTLQPPTAEAHMSDKLRFKFHLTRTRLQRMPLSLSSGGPSDSGSSSSADFSAWASHHHPRSEKTTLAANRPTDHRRLFLGAYPAQQILVTVDHHGYSRDQQSRSLR